MLHSLPPAISEGIPGLASRTRILVPIDHASNDHGCPAPGQYVERRRRPTRGGNRHHRAGSDPDPFASYLRRPLMRANLACSARHSGLVGSRNRLVTGALRNLNEDDRGRQQAFRVACPDLFAQRAGTALLEVSARHVLHPYLMRADRETRNGNLCLAALQGNLTQDGLAIIERHVPYGIAAAMTAVLDGRAEGDLLSEIRRPGLCASGESWCGGLPN